MIDASFAVSCPYCDKKNFFTAITIRERALRSCKYCSKFFVSESQVTTTAVAYALFRPFPGAPDLVKRLGGTEKVYGMSKNEVVGKVIIIAEEVTPSMVNLIDYDQVWRAVREFAISALPGGKLSANG